MSANRIAFSYGRWRDLGLILFVILGVQAVSGLQAKGEGFSSLLENSPFGEATRQAPATPPSRFQFCGYLYEGGEPLLALSRTGANGRIRSTWVTVGEDFDAHKVQAFDRSNETVTVEGAEGIQVLKLHRGQIAMPAPSGQNPDGLSGGSERVEDVLVEILRRRATAAGSRR